ncbi:polysaccharide deacetylase family protein [Lapillicoccus jejuensis]|uniref:Peptidoglycan/xylan/chitin deacetylase (PgdA/CDA1 family) n=1 Tax=Lapillicoccus jejuensis TaxID=402171 RepID=A0A542E295_9MICO|nr:polysaccharide deacetylase family protein [Lapillicoccus jejuensis]TQJ09460.1 peptidoglycan/xylan/chitin deacetylase (PgdA/CDA1 family) [Lapillicoccus jejuensis]
MTSSERPLPRRAVVGGLVGGVVGAGALLAGCDSGPTTVPIKQSSAAGTPPPTGTSAAPGTVSTTSTTSTTASAPATPAVLSTPGPDIASGSASTPAVALTFHGAGDVALAHRVLTLLQQRGAKVTVFAVGTWLSATPSVGREIVAEGHALGNHTWSHPTLTHLGLAAATDEVRRGADAVATSVGHAGLLFRPSGTPTSTPTIRAAAASAGYARSISYDLDSLDYTDPGADAVVRTVTAGLHPGAIVSLHLGHPGTLTALPRVLDALQATGLSAVTVPTLLEAPA